MFTVNSGKYDTDLCFRSMSQDQLRIPFKVNVASPTAGAFSSGPNTKFGLPYYCSVPFDIISKVIFIHCYG